jgi:hypothetical protein
MHPRPLVSFRLALAAASLFCAVGARVDAASKIQVAAIRDGAPGGGQFLGPSLTGSPTAAGDGWVAFRTLVTGGGTSEQIIGRNLKGVTTDGNAAFVVAAIGQKAPRVDDKDLGSFKQFLGRPAINANGDVAFTATLTNSDVLPGSLEDPIPAGVFLYRRTAPAGQRLRAVALSRTFYADFGQIDLGTPIDILEDPSGRDIPERTPAINAAGDVAFAAAVTSRFTEDGGREGGDSAAIFIAVPGARAEPVVKLTTTVGGREFAVLGPPALTGSGTLVFRALLEDLSDGIFAHGGTQTTALVQSGRQVVTPEPEPITQDLFDFGPVVAVNDQGDVVFTAGPLIDFNLDSLDFEGAPGVFVLHDGELDLLAYPGQPVPAFGRVTNVTLGPDGGNEVAPPGITASGRVVFFAELNNGNRQSIFRVDPPYDTSVILPYVLLGGPDADDSPIGGTYQAAASAPVTDAAGNVTFYARLAGAATSEALLFLTPDGGFTDVQVGGATPSKATLAGPPFSSVVATDDGRVVFKSFLAAGTSGVGIFQWQQTGDPERNLSLLVRAGDAVPLPCAPRITDLAGEVSANDKGDIAFAATISSGTGAECPEGGRVLLARRGGVLGVVAKKGDVVPTPPAPDQSEMRSVATNPLVLPDGSIVFRGAYDYPDPLIPFNFVIENAIFLVTPAGETKLLARSGQQSPVGMRFLRFRDLASGGGARLVFRSTLDDLFAPEPPLGLFFVDGAASVVPIALQGSPLPDGPFVDELSGRPVIDEAGTVAWVAKLSSPGSASPSLVRRTPDGASSILAQVGEDGPLGGKVRSLGRPTIGAKSGHIAFRIGFESGLGGAAGYHLVTEAGIAPFLVLGESAAGGGGERLVSINPSSSLDSNDRLAFIASVSEGKARNGIFLASPATLAVARLGGRLREPLITDERIIARDTVRGRALLTGTGPGSGRRGHPGAVTIWLGSRTSTVFTTTVQKKDLGRSGSTFRLKRKVGKLRGLTVRRSRGGFSVSFSAAGVDLFTAEPSLVLRIDVGSDSATTAVACELVDPQVVCAPAGSAASRR